MPPLFCSWRSCPPSASDPRPRVPRGQHPAQIVQNHKYIAFLYEQNSWFHVTPIDGRPHPKDPDATWYGNSVGHWDGDTLIIDTIAFNGRTKLDTDGHPHSDQLHTIETM